MRPNGRPEPVRLPAMTSDTSEQDLSPWTKPPISPEPPGAVDAPKPEPVAGPPNLGAILSIPVTVQVVLGSTSLPVAGLMKLARGAIVSLDQRVGDPVDVVVEWHGDRARRDRRRRRSQLSDSACRCSRSSPALVRTSRHSAKSAEGRPCLRREPSGERELSGPEKAAALLLMMDKPPAGRLLKQFDQSDLRAVARAAAGLGAIPATTLDRLVEEFAAGFSAGRRSARRRWTSQEPARRRSTA